MTETAPTVKVINAKLPLLVQALAALDGLRTSPDSIRPYRFDADVVWSIVAVQTKASEALDKFQRAVKMLAAQNAVVEGMKITPENLESVTAFRKAQEELTDKEIDLAIERLSIAKLNVGPGEKQNPIPVSVLSALMPILEN